MISPRPTPRRPIDVRSQLALELALLALAVVTAALLLRVLFRSLRIGERIWSGSVVYRLTDPLVWPLARLPGAERPVIGDATLPDLTTLAACGLIVLALATRRR